MRIVAQAWLSSDSVVSRPVIHVGAPGQIVPGCPDREALPRLYKDHSGESA